MSKLMRFWFGFMTSCLISGILGFFLMLGSNTRCEQFSVAWVLSQTQAASMPESSPLIMMSSSDGPWTTGNVCCGDA
ncbi:hypothetical protein HanPSC8_Chr10g0417231 [Helianthus annuus]|nr:hypothetical protein HanPSC8_Chr10g0417231 [Helianthus annuus]